MLRLWQKLLFFLKIPKSLFFRAKRRKHNSSEIYRLLLRQKTKCTSKRDEKHKEMRHTGPFQYKRYSSSRPRSVNSFLARPEIRSKLFEEQTCFCVKTIFSFFCRKKVSWVTQRKSRLARPLRTDQSELMVKFNAGWCVTRLRVSACRLPAQSFD